MFGSSLKYHDAIPLPDFTKSVSTQDKRTHWLNSLKNCRLKSSESHTSFQEPRFFSGGRTKLPGFRS